ncbi:DUF2384 domain-containing protein [Sphingomonas suaedae]|uniref:DUF2384 domain-containing protein n=1 Tax=Sphingomonas suaedae TaxID=2599297 RepID=A0A518RKA1_9SPHN|nr:antitoxin Xre/MbcA/ParS toxin-binding domain-containing protein [Sphingomonas suaedae]QDX27877.1 DUF2384 domain-containing protein [Sphingomonas suaedae]
MTPATAAPTPETEKPRTRQFRRHSDKPRLSPEAAARQGRAATLAWERLRDSEAVVAFLNTHDDRLGGRPIDLAIAGDDGLAAVVAHLDALYPLG